MVAIHDLLYQLRLADQSMTQLFERQLGISLTRYQILCFLIDQSPCNQIAVQERLKIDQAALTRHFKILEKEGLVERHRNPENQREMLVEATKYSKDQLVMNPPLQYINVKQEMESIATQSDATSRVFNMEKEGLVDRRRNPENQREVLVEVTDFARGQLVTNSPQQHIKVKSQMESVLTKGEREEFSRLLEKLQSGLEEIEI